MTIKIILISSRDNIHINMKQTVKYFNKDLCIMLISFVK
jgi:hypothetical protein